jgi:hypothetical protein
MRGTRSGKPARIYLDYRAAISIIGLRLTSLTHYFDGR